jgi:hypothetical protein
MIDGKNSVADKIAQAVTESQREDGSREPRAAKTRIPPKTKNASGVIAGIFRS